MATTLNRNNTDLLYSQRTFTNEGKTNGDAIGDWFRSIWQFGNLTTGQYNAIVDDYNNREAEADSGVLTGTDPSNNQFLIGGQPTRPRPIHK